MFPSWDSLAELEHWQDTLGRIGFWVSLIVGFIGLSIAAVWGTYNRKVDQRVAGLKAAKASQEEAQRSAEAEELRRTADDVQKRIDGIPPRTGSLYPGDGEMPPLPELPSVDEFRPDGMRNDEWNELRKRFESDDPLKRIPASATYLFLGDSVAWTDNFPVNIVAQEGEIMLSLDKEGDGLLLSAKFFDKRGKIVASIIKNRFHLNHKVFRIDRDKDNELVVFDDEDRRVFALEFINPRGIRLIGDFYLRNSVRVVLSPGIQKFGGFVLHGPSIIEFIGGRHEPYIDLSADGTASIRNFEVAGGHGVMVGVDPTE